MNSCDAYALIRQAIKADPRKLITNSYYDDRHFGSFVINFEEDGEQRSIVNDRGFVVLAEGSDGIGEAMSTVASLYEADRQSLLQGRSL